ncbi:wobble nucleotide-excising tRNase [Mycetocola sp. BIGb0189]|uniref:AAA family ATPase n=1 Tax=Mycetocola sp. BIGb0189 TaxID=2940604 RepID=UPI002167260C|nr:AAA family ATPase [Mycetocola sp. BIGb0189]MCS4275279.1 wobble nucleotide-excising tRNase [Mycetocola sp. BIGb0189]
MGIPEVSKTAFRKGPLTAMLQQLVIVDAPCFGSEPVTIPSLERSSFIFGPNGSGKTSISRALAGESDTTILPSWLGLPMGFRVYNHDFVSKILAESSSIPGVFVLGEKNVEAAKRLEEIVKPKGEQDRTLDAKTALEKTLEKNEMAEADAVSALQTATWSAYKNLIDQNPILNHAFTGIGSGNIGKSKKALVDKLLLIETGSTIVPELEDLLHDASAVFEKTSASVDEIPVVQYFDFGSKAGFSLLAEPIIGSQSAPLRRLIEKLSSSSWVASGRAYIDHSDGTCPFCQQKLPSAFASELAAMFDDQYESQVNQITELQTDFAEWKNSVLAILDLAQQDASGFIEIDSLQVARRNLEQVLVTNIKNLELKKLNPELKIDIVDEQKAIDDVNFLLKSSNTKIKNHNDLVAGRNTERPELMERCQRYLGVKLLGELFKEFQKSKAKRDSTQTKLEQKIGVHQATLLKLEEEKKQLHRSVESSLPVIAQINSILTRTGFTSFRIVESDKLADGYMLDRDGEVLDEHSLSEGERTFIAFLYFYHWLEGKAGNEQDTSQLVAVIDDPISSLDADVLFVVSSLIRTLIKRSESPTARVGQVIVLTHNVYFHKEVTYLRDGDKGQNRSYYTIRKNADTANSISKHVSNPITSEYRRLWGEVKKTIDGEPTSNIGLENILRRILETYFRVMGGGIWDKEFETVMSAEEVYVFRSLFSWINEGSHAILEDVFYSPSEITQDTYLKAFRRVFEATSHLAHYDMMLKGKASLH